MSTLRPELHVTAERGILDAAAGMLRNGDDWHLFYQYETEPGAPTRWAHQFSEGTPFDFYECDDVVVPVGGETRVLAGSVVASKTGTSLYFTSETSAGTTIQVAHVDDIDALCEHLDESDDVDPGVRRLGPVVKDTGRFLRFRSPLRCAGLGRKRGPRPRPGRLAHAGLHRPGRQPGACGSGVH